MSDVPTYEEPWHCKTSILNTFILFNDWATCAVLRGVNKKLCDIVSNGISNNFKIHMFKQYFGHLSIDLLNVNVEDITKKFTTLDMTTWELYHKNIPFKTIYFIDEVLYMDFVWVAQAGSFNMLLRFLKLVK